MDYFPSQPLSGNGGCPVAIDDSGNNSVFLDQLYLASGIQFANHKAAPLINAYNFAINNRCYDIKNTNTLYDPTMIDNGAYHWSTTSVNYDTAMGMSNIH